MTGAELAEVESPRQSMDDIIPQADDPLLIPELATRQKPKRGNRSASGRMPTRGLGPRDYMLLQELQRYSSWSQLGYVYPSQKTLATKLGCTVRWISESLWRLCEVGLLRKEKDGKKNRYYAPGDGPTARLDTGRIVPLTPEGSFRSHRKDRSGVIHEMSKGIREDKPSSSKRPAAAAPEGQQSPLLARELSDLGLSIGLANHLVGRDPQLAEVGLPMLRAKILSGEARDPPGFIRGFFNNPEAYNFFKSAGGWSAAPIASGNKSGNILNGRKLRRYRPPEGD